MPNNGSDSDKIERLMIVVMPQSGSERLVRLGRRTATMLNIPWMVVYVDTGGALNDVEQRQLAGTLDLARALGAEVISTSGADLVESLLRVARERSVTQMMLGKPPRMAWQRRWGLRTTIDQLIQQSGEIDLYLVQPEWLSERRRPALMRSPKRWIQMVWALLVLVLVTALGGVIENTLGYPSVPLLYLVALILAPLFLDWVPVMFLAVGSALAWWFFYLPYQFSLRISRLEDGLMLVLFLVAALVNGHLASRLRARERGGIEGEKRARVLYDLLRGLTESRDIEAGGLDRAVVEVERVFHARAVLFRPNSLEASWLMPHPAGHLDPHACDIEAAVRAWQTRQWTGWGMDAQSEAHATCVPLLSGGTAWGVLVIQLPAGEMWSALQRELMESIAHLLATMMERDEVARQAQAARIATESQKMQRALVDNFSHQMQTPLSVLSSAIQNLQQPTQFEKGRDILQEASIAVSRLNLVVSEMLDLVKLDSGMLKPTLEWCDTADFLREWLDGKEDAHSTRRIVLSVPETAVYVRVDTRLLSTVLDNVLSNALRHAPADTSVDVEAFVAENRVLMQISDRGPGVPAWETDRIFERFYRGTAKGADGVGLGLAIAKEFVELMGGTIAAATRPASGACFTIAFPCTRQLPLAEDAETSSLV